VLSDIRCDVEPIGTRLVVRVVGELSLKSASRVRMAILKCLVEQPDAVVVDLADAVIVESAAASVFLAAARQGAIWPGTPLMIVAPEPRTAHILTSAYPRLAVFGSMSDALAAEPRPRLPAVGDVLLPITGASRRARDLATQACTTWNLPHLIGPASLIAGEFVSNGVQHAQTMMELRFSLGRRYLVVAVRDGSTERPQPGLPGSVAPEAPRGLMVVNAIAHRWGTLPARDGKVVWATLRRSQPD
jgi:anti-anti-sigma regulatory factor